MSNIHSNGFSFKMNLNTHLRSWIILLVFLLENADRTTVNGATTVSIISPSDSRVEESSDLFLQCQIYDFVASSNRGLAWTKNGELFAWNGKLQGKFASLPVAVSNITSGHYTFYTLYFATTMVDDSGSYKCFITEGTVENFVEVVSDTKFMSIFHPYPVCSHLSETYLIKGSEKTITCEIESRFANTYPTLYWKNLKTDEIDYGITNSSEFSFVTELHLAVTLDLDNARYQCLTSVTSQESCTVGPFQVIEGVPTISPSSLTTYEGQTAIFKCNAPAHSVIEWFTIPETQADRITSTTPNYFTITNSNIAEDDGKIVVCKATIRTHELEDRAILSVLQTPTTSQATPPPPTTTTLPTTLLTRMSPVKTTTKTVTKQATTASPEPTSNPKTIFNNAPSTDTTVNPATSHSETKKINFTTAFSPLGSDKGISNVLIIAVGSAAVGVLFVIFIIMLIVSYYYFGCCDVNDKAEIQSLTSAHSDGEEGKIPITGFLETLDTKTLNGSTMSLHMESGPDGYHSKSQQGNYTPLGSSRRQAKTPNGSVRSYSSITSQRRSHMNYSSLVYSDPDFSIEALNAGISYGSPRSSEAPHVSEPQHAGTSFPGNYTPTLFRGYKHGSVLDGSMRLGPKTSQDNTRRKTPTLQRFRPNRRPSTVSQDSDTESLQGSVVSTSPQRRFVKINPIYNPEDDTTEYHTSTARSSAGGYYNSNSVPPEPIAGESSPVTDSSQDSPESPVINKSPKASNVYSYPSIASFVFEPQPEIDQQSTLDTPDLSLQRDSPVASSEDLQSSLASFIPEPQLDQQHMPAEQPQTESPNTSSGHFEPSTSVSVQPPEIDQDSLPGDELDILVPPTRKESSTESSDLSETSLAMPQTSQEPITDDTSSASASSSQEDVSQQVLSSPFGQESRPIKSKLSAWGKKMLTAFTSSSPSSQPDPTPQQNSKFGAESLTAESRLSAWSNRGQTVKNAPTYGHKGRYNNFTNRHDMLF